MRQDRPQVVGPHDGVGDLLQSRYKNLESVHLRVQQQLPEFGRVVHVADHVDEEGALAAAASPGIPARISELPASDPEPCKNSRRLISLLIITFPAIYVAPKINTLVW